MVDIAAIQSIPSKPNHSKAIFRETGSSAADCFVSFLIHDDQQPLIQVVPHDEHIDHESELSLRAVK